MAEETVESIAYAEATRAIQSQQDTLESARARAATLLSAASLVTAFLGGQALAGPILENGAVTHAALSAWSWLGISAFLVVVALSLVTLFPYRWRSQVSATRILQSTVAVDVPIEAIQRDLARYLDANRDKNARLLGRLFLCLSFASAFLFIEAIAWIIDLA
jgi:MFS family permease